jgi:hypothetical protein
MSKYLGLLGLSAFMGIMGAARDEGRWRSSPQQVATRPAGQPSSRPTAPREPRRLGPPQPTRVRLDVFRLTIPYEKGVDFSLDQVRTDGNSNKDLLETLGKLGQAALMYRFDETVDLAGDTTLLNEQREPVVTNATMVRGVLQRQISFIDTACRLTILGQWGTDQRSDREADVSMNLRLNYIEPSSMNLGGGIEASSMLRVDSQRSLRATSGKPVLSAFFSLDEPQAKGSEGQEEKTKEPRRFRVCIVRLQLDRLTGVK